MSGEGKKVGLIGGVIAALGGAVAHGADDCARVGVRGVSAEAAGVRAAGNVGDDVARVGARGGTRVGGDLGRGALGRGRVPAAPLVVPGVVDDMGRASVRAAGFESEVGLAAVGDEVASGAKPWRTLAEELGQEVSVDVLSEVLDADSPSEPATDAVTGQPASAGSVPAARPSADAAKGVEPTLIALVPIDAREYRLGFRRTLDRASGEGIAQVAQSFGKTSGFVRPLTAQHLFASLGTKTSKVGVVIGYLHPEKASALSLPSAEGPLELSTLHARAAAARSTLWVLACGSDDFHEREPCAVGARGVLAAALAARPRDAAELGRELVRARDRAEARALSVHGVARAKGSPRLVHSKP